MIIMRDNSSGDGIEVLMVRRHARSDFAGDMHVFPGGAVEEADCEEGMAALCDGMCSGDAVSILGDVSDPARALGLFVAGIRETFEEAGILLARDALGECVSYRQERAAHFAAMREALREEKLAFNEMIVSEKLKLAVSSLVYFAHWITPEFSPIRFDTRFFLAPAPRHQEALHDNVEITAHLWIAPQEALKRNESGTFAMLPPTVVNLMALTRFSNVEEALRTSVGRDVPVIAPQVSFEDGRMRLSLSEDPDSP
ncbi:MAG: NUDIX hydrolase [Actinobacteria bacterium]|nr:NUDIX hydrolase [Actinomycetota bacterium]